MNIRYRRIYFSSMVIIFLIAAPLLVLYATGWRYNIKTYTVEKKTAITISTAQRGASVSLNDILINHTTPLTINNLVSGSYDISVFREGYFNWSKTAHAFPDKVTRISEIRLIQDPGIPTPQLRNQRLFALSHSTHSFATVSDITVNYYTDSAVLIDTFSSDLSIKKISWSPSDKYLMLELDDDSFVVVDITTPEKKYPLSDFTEEFTFKYRWSQSEPNIIYLMTENGLVRVNLFQGTKTVVREDNTQTYISDEVYEQMTGTHRALLNSSFDTTTILPIDPSHTVEYSNINNSTLLAHDMTDAVLHFVNMETGVIETFPNKVSHFAWNGNDNFMIYNNANELWSYDWKSSKHNLILRTSNELHQSFSIAEGTHIAFSTVQGEVKIIELLGPQRNTYTYEINNIKNVYTNSQQNRLYLLGADELFILDI